MLGQHTDIVRWKVGTRVYFDRDPSWIGTVIKMDEPPFTCVVKWDHNPEPDVMWSNRLVELT